MPLESSDLKRLDDLAPAGYALVLHISYGFPGSSHVTYPKKWIELYTREVYQMKDPVARWGIANEGSIRWSAIPLTDSDGVLLEASRFGLTYGTAVAIGPIKSRSICGFARTDREHTDDEVLELAEIAARAHLQAAPQIALTAAQKAALRQVSHGHRYARAAWELEITEGALKARLLAAQRRLGARTVSEAVARATLLNLL